MSACCMSTHIVQIAYKNCFEMDDFGPAYFLKNKFWRRGLTPPPSTFTNLLSEGVI